MSEVDLTLSKSSLSKNDFDVLKNSKDARKISYVIPTGENKKVVHTIFEFTDNGNTKYIGFEKEIDLKTKKEIITKSFKGRGHAFQDKTYAQIVTNSLTKKGELTSFVVDRFVVNLINTGKTIVLKKGEIIPATKITTRAEKLPSESYFEINTGKQTADLQLKREILNKKFEILNKKEQNALNELRKLQIEQRDTNRKIITLDEEISKLNKDIQDFIIYKNNNVVPVKDADSYISKATKKLNELKQKRKVLDMEKINKKVSKAKDVVNEIIKQKNELIKNNPEYITTGQPALEADILDRNLLEVQQDVLRASDSEFESRIKSGTVLSSEEKSKLSGAGEMEQILYKRSKMRTAGYEKQIPINKIMATYTQKLVELNNKININERILSFDTIKEDLIVLNNLKEKLRVIEISKVYGTGTAKTQAMINVEKDLANFEKKLKIKKDKAVRLKNQLAEYNKKLRQERVELIKNLPSTIKNQVLIKSDILSQKTKQLFDVSKKGLQNIAKDIKDTYIDAIVKQFTDMQKDIDILNSKISNIETKPVTFPVAEYRERAMAERAKLPDIDTSLISRSVDNLAFNKATQLVQSVAPELVFETKMELDQDILTDLRNKIATDLRKDLRQDIQT